MVQREATSYMRCIILFSASQRQTASHMGRTLHLYTNPLITVDGDEAHLTCNVQATHVWESERGPRYTTTQAFAATVKALA